MDRMIEQTQKLILQVEELRKATAAKTDAAQFKRYYESLFVNACAMLECAKGKFEKRKAAGE